MERLKSYFNKKDLLPHICSTAKGQPQPYRLVLKFIPCNGSFSPANEDHLHSLEVDHGIEEGSIIAASWIKKPELRSPNQRTANVKVLCSMPQAANCLLLERVFVTNARVVVIKDTQDPIRCNKCQEYSHMHEKCPNDEHCMIWARPHPTSDCTHSDDCHCISCGASSNHASSDRINCPQFSKHAALLDAHVPENSLLYYW